MMRPASDKTRVMRARSPLTLRFLVAGLASVATAGPAASAEFTQLATHVFITDDSVIAACRLSNAGKSAIRVKDLKIQDYQQNTLPPTSNTCGDPASFKLKPNSSCYIQMQVVRSTAIRCLALVSDPKSARGALEEIGQGAPRHRLRLRPGVGSSSAGKFKLLASPPTFGSSNQVAVDCDISNVGKTPVRLKKREIVTSTGAPIAIATDTCGDTLQAGQNCYFSANANAPLTDRQCRVMVTRKANLRGGLSYTHIMFPTAEME